MNAEYIQPWCNISWQTKATLTGSRQTTDGRTTRSDMAHAATTWVQPPRSGRPARFPCPISIKAHIEVLLSRQTAKVYFQNNKGRHLQRRRTAAGKDGEKHKPLVSPAEFASRLLLMSQPSGRLPAASAMPSHNHRVIQSLNLRPGLSFFLSSTNKPRTTCDLGAKHHRRQACMVTTRRTTKAVIRRLVHPCTKGPVRWVGKCQVMGMLGLPPNGIHKRGRWGNRKAV